MAVKLDLTDQMFGRLKVIEEIPIENVNHQRRWLCQCSCGNTTESWQHHLRRGKAQSCGCLKVEAATKHGGSYSRLYSIWSTMIQRCINPKTISYDRYGGRGIRVCATWQDFEPFQKWALANGYSEKLTIDRIKGDKGYMPANCRWATMSTQIRNSKARGKTSKYRGVSWVPSRKKWIVSCLGKNVGRFPDEIEAANARDNYIRKNQLKDFNMNFPQKGEI